MHYGDKNPGRRSRNAGFASLAPNNSLIRAQVCVSIPSMHMQVQGSLREHAGWHLCARWIWMWILEYSVDFGDAGTTICCGHHVIAGYGYHLPVWGVTGNFSNALYTPGGAVFTIPRSRSCPASPFSHSHTTHTTFSNVRLVVPHGARTPIQASWRAAAEGRSRRPVSKPR
jgi:hypothetical protein